MNKCISVFIELTREGYRLGSRMGVGHRPRIPLPLGSAYYFFIFSFSLSVISVGCFLISPTINSIVFMEYA